MSEGQIYDFTKRLAAKNGNIAPTPHIEDEIERTIRALHDVQHIGPAAAEIAHDTLAYIAIQQQELTPDNRLDLPEVDALAIDTLRRRIRTKLSEHALLRRTVEHYMRRYEETD